MIELSVSLASNGVVKGPGYEQMLRFGYTKNRGVYQLRIDAAGEWKGLAVRCFWHVPGGKDPPSSLVVDGHVDVPASVTAQPGNGCITFEGSDGTKTVTSADLRYRVAANSGTEDGTEPEPGTPAWQAFVDAVKDAAELAEQSKTEAVDAAERAGASAQKAEQALSDTITAKEDALKAIGDKQTAATQAVDTARDKALQQVEASTDAAQTAAGEAAASAGNASQSAQEAADSLQELKDGIANGNFKGEKGDKGDTGPQGEKGDTGPQGPKGEAGPAVALDTTLTHEGEAADAKATGNAISAVKARQNILVGTETGNPIAVDDAFSAPLCSLTVYGKSTQDGTPTPDAPVPIVSAGDGGSVVVKVTGKNLFPVVTNANLSKINKPTGGVRYGYVFYVPAQSSVTASGNADIGTNCFVGDFDIKTQTYTQKAQLVSEKGGVYAATLQSGWYVIYIANDYLPTILIKLNDAKIQLEIGTEATVYEPYREQLLTLPTPTGLPGIPVTSGGNYTDQSGQQWVCDELDLERGVKVQRIDKTSFDNTKTLAEQNAILATPVETPLTPAEIAAYKALTSYAPDTVVQAGDGAGVKLEYQRDVNIAIKNLEDAIASMTAT